MSGTCQSSSTGIIFEKENGTGSGNEYDNAPGCICTPETSQAISSTNFFRNLKPYPQSHQLKASDSWIDFDIAPVLDATTDFLPFFDAFGTLLTVCKNDFNGNVLKLRKRASEFPGAKTFADLIRLEKEKNEAKLKNSAATALLWYSRGLNFIVLLLNNVIEMEGESMQVIFNSAYEKTLKKYHNWVVQKAIAVVCKTLSSRTDLMKRFGWQEDGTEMFMRDVRNYWRNLAGVSNSLTLMVSDLGLDPSNTSRGTQPT